MEKMSTMQKIVAWVSILIGVFILSDLLIAVGINSAYRDIRREDRNEQIVVYQAEATYVNGRMRGLIKEVKKDYEGKYLKVALYSKRDVLVGESYIEIQDVEEGETQPFELLFKAKDVAYYKLEIVEEKKEEGKPLEILPKDLTRPEIVFGTIVAFLIFWG